MVGDRPSAFRARVPVGDPPEFGLFSPTGAFLGLVGPGGLLIGDGVLRGQDGGLSIGNGADGAPGQDGGNGGSGAAVFIDKTGALISRRHGGRRRRQRRGHR